MAVSSGLLRSMSRQQIEAVLGHEISHVANGDMVTLALLQGVLNTFVIFLARIIGGIVDRALFKNDMVEQGRNLTAMISVAVGSLSKPERIRLAVRQLGERHAAYGVERRHYELVGTALIWMLDKVLGEAFTPEVKAAWWATYAFLAEAMQEAACASSS